MTKEDIFEEVIKFTELRERKRILEFIESQRDNGNCEDGGFSAAICLSELIKYLEQDD